MQQKKIHMLAVAGGLLAGLMAFGSSAEAADATDAMLANTCAGCHGTNGVSAGPAMPTIAGMPAPYMIMLMEEFKSGDRPSTIMGRLAKGYSDKETAQIAAFFAKQKWQNAQSAPQSQLATPVSASLAKKGKKLAKKNKCGKCHEDNGVTQDEDTPRMAGQWVDYLKFKMDDYKNPDLDIPQPKKMKKRIRKMSAADLEAVAHFYAHQQ